MVDKLEIEMKKLWQLIYHLKLLGYKEEEKLTKRKWILIEWLKLTKAFSHFRF